MKVRITAAVVTHNRKECLLQAVKALLAQSRPLDEILILDNASTDGTYPALRETGLLNTPSLVYQRLEHNSGGAGGFAAAVERFLAGDHQWLWLLDDDALIESDALRVLMERAVDWDSVYCSVAVGLEKGCDELCWPVAMLDQSSKTITTTIASHLPAIVETTNAPFLGMLLHRSLMERIGVPDRGFFISGDDAEYCHRIRRQGGRILMVKASRVRHPLPKRRPLRLLGHTIQVLELAPWKRYYEIRNRLIIAKRYHGYRLWTQAVPGTLLRWLMTLLVQNRPGAQSKAFAYGLLHGLLDRTGMYWPPGR